MDVLSWLGILAETIRKEVPPLDTTWQYSRGTSCCGSWSDDHVWWAGLLFLCELSTLMSALVGLEGTGATFYFGGGVFPSLLP